MVFFRTLVRCSKCRATEHIETDEPIDNAELCSNCGGPMRIVSEQVVDPEELEYGETDDEDAE